MIMIFLILILGGCHNNKGSAGHDDLLSSEELTSDMVQDEYIITKEQFETGGMKIGNAELMEFKETVRANGYITPSPNGQAKVGSLISGKVKQVHVNIGEQVKKGALLFTMEGNEIILIQQEYAEACSKLVLFKSNFERQKVLSKEQISAGKELVLAESEYMGILAITEGLKERLRMINIDPELVGQGIITSTIPIKAPIKGYVTQLDLVVGQSVEPTDMILEIIDTELFQLSINVFRKDLMALVPGQVVNFYEPGNKTREFEAVLSNVGKTISTETKTVQCVSTLKPSDRGTFVNNAFVEAEIITCKREVVALPGSSVTEEEGRYYALILVEKNESQYKFRKTLLKTGILQNDFVEILDESLENVLIKGAYSLIK